MLKNIDDPDLNKEMLRDKIKFRFSIKNRNADKINWVVELPPQLYKALTQKERVYIGFLSYKIKMFVSITRCFKCYGYGHSARNCTVEHQLCERCGETGHLKASCKSETVCCINCKKGRKAVNHSVKDSNCPEYLKQVDLFYKRTQWT